MKKYIYYIISFLYKDFKLCFSSKFKLKKKLIIFDVGCYRGIFLKSLKKILFNKKATIYMFDPNPNIPKYLNFQNNVNHKFFFFNSAVSNKNSKSSFYLNKSFEASGSSLNKNIYPADKKWNFSRNLFLSLFLQKTEGYSKITVKTLKLDSFIKKKNIKNIDVIKIDVEGAEELVLDGLKSALKKKIIDFIQIEISEKKKYYFQKEKRIQKILKKNGYHLIKKVNLSSVSLFSNTKSTDSLYCKF